MPLPNPSDLRIISTVFFFKFHYFLKNLFVPLKRGLESGGANISGNVLHFLGSLNEKLSCNCNWLVRGARHFSSKCQEGQGTRMAQLLRLGNNYMDGGSVTSKLDPNRFYQWDRPKEIPVGLCCFRYFFRKLPFLSKRLRKGFIDFFLLDPHRHQPTGQWICN